MLSLPAGNICQAFHRWKLLLFCILLFLYVICTVRLLHSFKRVFMNTFADSVTPTGKNTTVRDIISCVLVDCLFFPDVTGIIWPCTLAFDCMSVTSKHKTCSCGVPVFIQAKQINARALQGWLNYHRQPCWICRFQICIELMKAKGDFHITASLL